MAKNDNKNFSLPTIKDLEIYIDLIKKKDISELEIEKYKIFNTTNRIRNYQS